MNKIIEDILWSIYYQTSSENPRRGGRFILLNEILKDVHGFTAEQLRTAVVDIKKQKLIEKKNDYENSILVSLTEKGMLRVVTHRFRVLENKKEKWDGKWRMVAFDIPNSCRKGRNALRYRLKASGFYELQESLFLFPYDCKKEVDEFIRLYKLEKYVRFALLDFIDNEDKLKFRFKLN